MIKRGLSLFGIGILGIVLLVVLGVGIGLVVLEDDDYRRLLIRAVDSFTDYRLAIDGPFQVTLSTTPSVTASNIRVSSKKAASEIAIGQLDLTVAFTPLVYGTLFVNRLELAEAHITLDGSAPPEEDFDEEFLFGEIDDLLVPIFKSVLLRNIHLDYHPPGDGPAIHITLVRLSVDDLEDQGPILIKGEGEINGSGYQIQGQLGPKTELLRPTAPYPIEFRLENPELFLSVVGTVNEPIRVRGLDLEVETDIGELSYFVNAFMEPAPRLGRLDAKARVKGDLDSLAVSDMALTLTRGTDLAISAKGSIEDLSSGQGGNVEIKGFVNDLNALKWMLPTDLLNLSRMKFEATVITAGIGYRVNHFVAHAVDLRGLTLSAQGGGVIGDIASSQPFRELDLSLSFTSPTTEAAKIFLIDALPELGPVAGSGRLAVPAEVLSVEDIDIKLGRPGELELVAKGRIGKVPLDPDQPNSDIDLELTIQAGRTERLSYLFGTTFPELGPATVSGRFRGSIQRSTLDDLKLRAGKRGNLVIEADGGMRFADFGSSAPLDDLDLKISLSAGATAFLEPVFGQELPKIGPVKAKFNLTGSHNKLKIADATGVVGSKERLEISAKGEIRRLAYDPELVYEGVSFQVATVASSTRDLGPLIGWELPDLGSLKASARLDDTDGSLGIENAEIRVGPVNKPTIQAKGYVDDIRQRKEIGWEVQFDISTSAALAPYLQREVPDLGQMKGNFELSDKDGSLGFEDLDVHTSKPGLLTLNASGIFDDLRERDKLSAQADISARDLSLIGALFGRDWPPLGPVRASGHINGSDEHAAFEGLLNLGQTEIKAELSGSLTGDRPHLMGRIRSHVLHLADLGMKPDATAEAASPAPNTKKPERQSRKTEPLFSKEGLDLGFLKALDLSLHVDIGKVTGTEASLDAITAPVELKNGVLAVTPAVLVFEGGAVLIDFLLDSNARPRTALKMTADDVSLAPTLSHIQQTVPVEGNFNLHLDLSSNGHSPHDIASNLNGIIELAIENGGLPQHTLDLLAVDLFGWGLSKTLSRDRKAAIHCAIVRFEVEKGLLTSKVLFGDSPHMTLWGEGGLDLGAETIDLSLYPKKKRTLWTSVTPVRITGSLQDPSAKAIPASAAAKSYAGFALAPQIYLPVKALGYLWGIIANDDDKGQHSPCLEHAEASE